MKKAYRIYRKLRIHLRNKKPKRRVKAKPRDDRAEAVGPRADDIDVGFGT